MPARGRIRYRNHDRLPVCHGGCRTPGSSRSPPPGRSDPGRVDEGVRDPRRHTPVDRPHRCGPALLLRETQEARDEPAGPHGSLRPAVGLAGPARLCPAPSTMSARPRARHRRRPLPRPTSRAGRTRRIGVPAETSALPTGAAGKPSPPVRRPSTGPAKIRTLVEQAMATLKAWRLLRRLRCSTTRITSLVQAVLALHLASSE